MANYFPLILDALTPEIKELPSGDSLDMANSSIVNTASIDVVGNVTAGNLVAIETVGTGHLLLSGNITGNVTPSANVTYDLGTTDLRWKDLWLSNSTIHLGNAQMSANATSLIFTNPEGGQTVFSGTNPGISVTTVSATGNITGGNLNTAGQVVAAGNVSGNFFIGNGSQLTGIDATSIQNGTSNVRVIAADGDVTVGINGTSNVAVFASTGLEITGTIGATGNITGGNINSVANVHGSYFVGTHLLGSAGDITVQAAAGNSSVSLLPTGTGVVDVNSKQIINVAPPVNGNDAANKTYVDEVAEGLKARPAAYVATTANLDATYDNGASGVGATLTANSNGQFPVTDGVQANTTPKFNGVLVKNQTNPAQNGRYNLTTLGDAGNPWILTRCSLCDTATEIPGSYTFITDGDLYANTGWVQTVADPATFVVGTDAINILQFSGAGTYTAGTGLTLTGTEFSVNASQTQVTAVGTLVTGTWQANSISTTYTDAKVTSIVAGTGVSVSGATGDVTVNIGQAVGTGDSPTFAGLTLPAITKNGSNGVGNIGQSNNTFNTVFAKATSAQYADLAELYTADADYQPGTVLIFGGTAEVTESSQDHDTKIAGVVSTNPAHIMNSALISAHTAVVALMGRVPCRVVGTVRQGDCLVSSDIPGVAQALDATKYLPGAIIGKALQNYDSTEPGVIEAVVGRL